MSTRRGIFPGSFDPPTIAHLAIAEAAIRTHDLGTVVFSLSHDPLAKDSASQAPLEDRVAVLELESSRRPWLRVQVTRHRLLADIAEGFDLLIVGADKWHQIHDLRFYDDDPLARDAALERLPEVAVAPRPPFQAPADRLLEIDPQLAFVSSTGVRAGRVEHMTEPTTGYSNENRIWSANGNSTETDGVPDSEG